MRNGPNNNKRMRSRNNNNNNNNNNNRRGQNPMTRVFESNGPDIKIRGTASHVAEKYVQLARDARSSGDPVAAENYYQHAEHYFRLIAAAQEQFRQNQPQQQPTMPRNDSDALDDNGDDGDSYSNFGAEPGFAPGHQQPQPQFQPREQQPFQREQQQPREQHFRDRDRDQRPQPQPSVQPAESEAVDRLPSFITGGAQPQPNGNSAEPNGNQSGERFGHRRRRRPPGPRPEGQSAQPPAEDFSAGE
jgi:hypothetical protein